jgi:hypothetical protein
MGFHSRTGTYSSASTAREKNTLYPCFEPEASCTKGSDMSSEVEPVKLVVGNLYRVVPMHPKGTNIFVTARWYELEEPVMLLRKENNSTTQVVLTVFMVATGQIQETTCQLGYSIHRTLRDM